MRTLRDRGGNPLSSLLPEGVFGRGAICTLVSSMDVNGHTLTNGKWAGGCIDGAKLGRARAVSVRASSLALAHEDVFTLPHVARSSLIIVHEVLDASGAGGADSASVSSVGSRTSRTSRSSRVSGPRGGRVEERTPSVQIGQSRVGTWIVVHNKRLSEIVVSDGTDARSQRRVGPKETWQFMRIAPNIIRGSPMV